MTGTNRETIIRFYTDDERTEYVEKSEEIIENTLTIEEILTDGELTFGVPCSNRFECQIVNDIQVTRKQTVYVYQIIDDDLDNPVDLFYGKVDSAIADASGYFLTITCYDRLYFMRNKSVRKWWKKYWKDDTHDFTIKGIREAFLTKYKFRFDDVTLFNDHRLVEKPTKFKTITFEELLTQLCAINACIPNMKRGGGLEFIELSNEVKHIFTEEEIELENCEFEWYDTPEIQGVTVESKIATASTGDEESEDEIENMFYLPYNMFFDGKNINTMQLRAQEYLDKIKHIIYRPFKVKMIVSDLDFHLGDRVQIEATYNGQPITYYSYILKNTLSGPLLVEQEVGADGEVEYTVIEPSNPEDVGGGGSTTLVDIKYDEWLEAFRQGTLEQGVIYNTVDEVESEIEGSGTLDYTTSVQDAKIKWIDGENIFQKTFVLDVTSTGSIDFTLDVRFRVMMLKRGIILDSSKHYIVFPNNSSELTFKPNKQITINANTVGKYYLTFEYTKDDTGELKGYRPNIEDFNPYNSIDRVWLIQAGAYGMYSKVAVVYNVSTRVIYIITDKRYGVFAFGHSGGYSSSTATEIIGNYFYCSWLLASSYDTYPTNKRVTILDEPLTADLVNELMSKMAQ